MRRTDVIRFGATYCCQHMECRSLVEAVVSETRGQISAPEVPRSPSSPADFARRASGWPRRSIAVLGDPRLGGALMAERWHDAKRRRYQVGSATHVETSAEEEGRFRPVEARGRHWLPQPSARR